MTIFFKCENFILTWTGYGDDVIGHGRKLKNELPNTNFPQITMQKELGRYLFPVFRKKYKTVRHLKKYPPKTLFQCEVIGQFRVIQKYTNVQLTESYIYSIFS